MSNTEQILRILEKYKIDSNMEVHGSTAYDVLDNAIAGALDQIEEAKEEE
jgi:hypothetical protein